MLHLAPQSEEIRIPETEIILAEIAGIQSSGRPTILLGDFNSSSIERQKQTGGSERAVIRDASGRITGQPDVPSGPNPDKIKQMVGKFDTGDQMNDVLVLTLSDFGRTVAENGTSGTDHGWANCMIAIGGGVAKNDKPVLGGQGWHRKISTKNVTSNTPRISVMF